VLIFSKPNQRKIRNLRQNPHAILALDGALLGVVTLDGEAELLDDLAINSTLAGYVAKYGKEIADIGYTPETMARVYSQAIRITPTRYYRAPTA
jgi:PPOX class probable F420-dependent enzyme